MFSVPVVYLACILLFLCDIFVQLLTVSITSGVDTNAVNMSLSVMQGKEKCLKVSQGKRFVQI